MFSTVRQLYVSEELAAVAPAKFETPKKAKKNDAVRLYIYL